MQFRTDAQKECYEKILPWLSEKFNGMIRPAEDLPAFFVTQGTAVLHIAIFPWGTADSVIQCRAYVVTDVELTPDLMSFLLFQNTQLRFGAFGIDGDGDIILEHSLAGPTADKMSIQTIAGLILASAVKYGAEIVARWGGQRAREPEINI